MRNALILVSVFLFFFSKNSFSQSMDAEKVAAVEELIARKLLKIEISTDKAWVSPSVWNSYNIEGKETFTFYCAQYIRYKERSSNKPSLDLYDFNSGKKIAEYSPIWGFSVED
jgi:hypothetical protein